MYNDITINLIQGLMCIISGILMTIGVIKIKGNYIKKSDVKRIGTIVVDHSDDGEANIFLEISNNDIEKWENGEDYFVRVEVRDYITHD